MISFTESYQPPVTQVTYSRTIHRQMPMAYEDTLLLHILAAWGVEGGSHWEAETERDPNTNTDYRRSQSAVACAQK